MAEYERELITERVNAGFAAAKAGVTTGEWGAVLREVFGEYRAPTGIGAEHTVDEVRSGARGTLRLGASSTLGPYFLPHVVAALHSQHPSLKLYVRECIPRELEGELLRGAHDIVLAQLPVEKDGR